MHSNRLLFILLILLAAIALLGSPPVGYFPAQWGWRGSGGVGTIIVILLILLLLGVI